MEFYLSHLTFCLFELDAKRSESRATRIEWRSRLCRFPPARSKMADASRPFAGLASVSVPQDTPVEGDISVPVHATPPDDDELSTLDEPVKETILRDLRAVAKKFVHVLYPKQSSELLRDWDLWGPLLLCVTLALLLQGGAAPSSGDQGGPQFAEVGQHQTGYWSLSPTRISRGC